MLHLVSLAQEATRGHDSEPSTQVDVCSGEQPRASALTFEDPLDAKYGPPKATLPAAILPPTTVSSAASSSAAQQPKSLLDLASQTATQLAAGNVVNVQDGDNTKKKKTGSAARGPSTKREAGTGLTMPPEGAVQPKYGVYPNRGRTLTYIPTVGSCARYNGRRLRPLTLPTPSSTRTTSGCRRRTRP
ncbi:hypothetical protein EXIGLDRAFT_239631 [Exidia glandulosa HHB12029]|uniref:Uncharacterized protein n=1 Tax=Exidia glandulosa HHB12029 TaxID=1314781 RepID=A0A165DYF8_EXIGL|nr:hypothetical protein EXIGLDRAFT_239631 [Exidia glandulosa HHB12029]